MLSGLTFDGNQANITSFPSPFDEQDSHCLYLCYVDGLRVKNIRIINAIRYSIFMVQCSHSSVRFSHIISSGTTLLGDGMEVSTIRAADGFSPNQVAGLYGLSVLVVANNAGGSNIMLSGLTFDGNQANICRWLPDPASCSRLAAGGRGRRGHGGGCQAAVPGGRSRG